MSEVWKVIPGYENYEVSDHGKVRRCAASRGAVAGKILRPKKHSFGYVAYDLSSNNCVKRETAHRLVAMAFIGPPPFNGAQAAHNDGNPRNNIASNIRWDTAVGNAADKKRHGTLLTGERHQNSKLTDEAVREIRRLRAEGVTYKKLSEIFGVAPSNIHAAANGKQWSHI